MSKRSNKLYLEDISQCIRKIQEYTAQLTYKEFSTDEMLIDASVRNIEIIGEAANQMEQIFKDQHPKRLGQK